MKKFIFSTLLLAMILCGLKSFATGAEGINPTQQGLINATSNSAAIAYYTNTFAFPFQSLPVVTLFTVGTVTNAMPYTNVVTTTNFVVQFATNGFSPTIYWQAYIGTPRIISMTPTNQTAGTATNILLPATYAYPPVVVVTGQGSASNAFVNVYGITTTNFTLFSNQLGTNQVLVFGIWASPSTSANTQAGYNDVKF